LKASHWPAEPSAGPNDEAGQLFAKPFHTLCLYSTFISTVRRSARLVSARPEFWVRMFRGRDAEVSTPWPAIPRKTFSRSLKDAPNPTLHQMATQQRRRAIPERLRRRHPLVNRKAPMIRVIETIVFDKQALQSEQEFSEKVGPGIIVTTDAVQRSSFLIAPGRSVTIRRPDGTSMTVLLPLWRCGARTWDYFSQRPRSVQFRYHQRLKCWPNAHIRLGHCRWRREESIPASP
jgi:hypothetical protein